MSPSDTIEEELRELHRERKWEELATLGVRHYGPELIAFAAALTQSISAADDVFADACEGIWTGLERFRFESSFRTWAFTITRRACLAYLNDPHRRRGKPLSAAGPLSELQQRVRTQTRPYLRDEAKDGLRQLRAALSTQEQELLSLRVDRGLSWSDIAIVLGDGEELPEDERKRREAALRKQFERLKERIRQLAMQSGML